MRIGTIRKVVFSCILGTGLAALSLRAPAANAPRRVEVVAKRFTYVPAEISLKKGEAVVIALRSEDVAHGLKFKELNLQADISKGATSELSFTPAQAGDFVGHCSHFCGDGHGSMILTLHVME